MLGLRRAVHLAVMWGEDSSAEAQRTRWVRLARECIPVQTGIDPSGRQARDVLSVGQSRGTRLRAKGNLP